LCGLVLVYSVSDTFQVLRRLVFLGLLWLRNASYLLLYAEFLFYNPDSFLLRQQYAHYHWLKDVWVSGVAACHNEASDHIHQLLESFTVILAQSSSEAAPPADFFFKSYSIRRNSFTQNTQVSFCVRILQCSDLVFKVLLKRSLGAGQREG
jgi:hypothetical protein